MAAVNMGRLLANSGQLPELIISSTAVRARQTLEQASRAGAWNIETSFKRELYGASAEKVLALLKRQPQHIGSILLIGHEPTWSSLTALLTGGSPPRFPTAAMARIDFNIHDWLDTAPGAGQLRWLLQPNFFKN